MTWWQAWLIAGAATMSILCLDRDFDKDIKKMIRELRRDGSTPGTISAVVYLGATVTVLLWPPFLFLQLPFLFLQLLGARRGD